MRPVSILFAKAPIPGRVKTRLTPPLTSEQAATLHDAFTRDIVQKLAEWESCSRVELHTDVDWDAWKSLGVSMRRQSGGDLGEKMLNAALTAGLPALIVGSDAPTLPIFHLDTLISRSEDVVLGPTDDGGYYAIFMRRTHPDMFRGVAWSTRTALADTIRAVQRTGLTVATGERWFDVDTGADLDRLRNAANLPQATANWMRTVR